MKHHLTVLGRVLAGALVAALALTACGTTEPAAAPGTTASTSAATAASGAGSSAAGSTGAGSTAASPSPASSASSAPAGPITLTDGAGRTVTLQAPAQRVVALEWREAEVLVSLGVMPVGVADTDGFATWDAAVELDDAVTDVGTRGEPSIDEIIALEPDLIVMTGGRSVADKAGQLAEQFSVFITAGADTAGQLDLLRREVAALATATGTQDRARTLLADMDAALEAGRQAVTAAGAAGSGFVLADGYREGSTVSIRVFAQRSLMSDVAEELGLRNRWTGDGDAAYGLAQTDVEGLSRVTDPQARMFYSASEDDPFVEGLSDNPIWQRLPWVTGDRLTKLERGTWTFGGPASVVSAVDQFVAAYRA